MGFPERASSRAGPTSAWGSYRFGRMLGRGQRGIGSDEGWSWRGRAPPCQALPKLAGITDDAGDRSRALEIARAPEAQPAPVITPDRAHFQPRTSKHAGRNADDFDAVRCKVDVV